MLALAALTGVSTVDEAIQLYEMGDIPGAIVALEEMISSGSLTFDEALRAWDRLGSSYFAMGNDQAARNAYGELLRLDVFYDLSPRANPRLQALLDDVRNNTMASAMVRSEPAGAFVTLDGQLMGVTPIMLDGLMGGEEYQVDVYQVGYETEYYTLAAQPGFSHMLQFDLDILPDQASVAVAAAGGTGTVTDTSQENGTGGQTGATGSLLPDEMVASPLEQNGGGGSSQQVGAGTQQTASSASSQPESTEALLAMLSGGGGIDMTALSSSGGFINGDSSENIGLAGASGGHSGIVSSGVAAQAEALGREVMVFSDISTQTAPEVTGTGSYSSRTAEEIAELVAQKRSQVMYVYNKHLRTDPLLMGRVDVAMIIHPSGRVSDVEIVSSNMYNQAFELELIRTVEQWRFGSVDENEGPLPIQLPFSFSP
ncbi:MAG TPA: TonB family protein [Candidatus Sabulitectum sp.]|nr:TonB family protein [Candidatus Sabulitectum sp.]HPR22186.1 TonB family protein [Candidatus Sabulitectum sp.]